MVDITRSMIDPQLNQQFKTVFYRFDTDKTEMLNYDQFEEFCFAIGLQFLMSDYSADVEKELFRDDKQSRVTYD